MKKPTTNIYVLLDRSYNNKQNIERLKSLLIRYERALKLSPYKTQLHCIGYNDKANFLNPKAKCIATGNPDLKEGLQMLNTVIAYQRKNASYQTRSVFILLTSGETLWGWKQALNELYKTKEFTLGLRYVITTKNEKQFLPFTDRLDRIIPYFSEHRLLSLVESIHANH